MYLHEVIEDMHQGINTVADKVEYQDTGIPIIQSKNFTKGFLDLEDVRYLGPEDEEKYSLKYNPHVGDILMANIGTIGKSYVIKEEQRFLIAWNVFLIKPKRKYVIPDFLKYYFDYLVTSRYFDKLLTGGTVKFINKKKIGEILVPECSIDEQMKIVQILSKVEQVIIKRQSQLEELDNLIKSRFVELFGDPITNTKCIETKELKDVLVLKAGDFTVASDISDEPNETNIYPCYGGNGIRGYVAEYNQEGEYSLVGRQGALSGNVQYARGKFKNTEHALLVTPIVEMNSIWLNQLLLNLDLKRYQTGAAQPGLSVKNLQEIEILMVPMSEQIEFAGFVIQVDKLKSKVQKSLNETQLLFDSLMQEYFG